jgi:hypothetical protein
MIAETLAGISLVKASVDFIKSNIDTAKDIGEIASAVDGLFRGADEIEKKRSRKAGVGIKDQFGIQSVAQEVIDARLAQEAMQEMKNMINMRFGPDTWQSIVDLRAKRIQEEKERIAEAKRLAKQRQKENEEVIKQVAMIGGVIAVAVGLFVFLIAIL